MSNALKVGVLGATSHVGQALLPLLVKDGYEVYAFSRQCSTHSKEAISFGGTPNTDLQQTGLSDIAASESMTGSLHWWPVLGVERLCQEVSISYWICLAPIWVVSDYFEAMQAGQAKRVVVLSSTSRFSKQRSPEPAEQALAKRLADSEVGVQAWAEGSGIDFVILRPTLIYGLGRDKNICEIIRLIRRFGFFPLLGQAKGLRQPVHCNDVARACVSALFAAEARNKSYNLSGSETLSYKDMITRVFEAINKSPHFFQVPLSILRVILVLLRFLPRYRHWRSSMLERMNQNLVFDHQEATRDLGFNPRSFALTAEDLP